MSIPLNLTYQNKDISLLIELDVICCFQQANVAAHDWSTSLLCRSGENDSERANSVVASSHP